MLSSTSPVAIAATGVLRMRPRGRLAHYYNANGDKCVIEVHPDHPPRMQVVDEATDIDGNAWETVHV